MNQQHNIVSSNCFSTHSAIVPESERMPCS